MVCAKCQKLNKTTLATPGVKKKSEMYYGSPASSSSSTGKKSATLGQTGISKVCFQRICWIFSQLTILQSKLLSKAAQNPYAQYSSACTRCKTKVSQGHSYCNQCAYRVDGGSQSFKTVSPPPLTLRNSLCHLRQGKQEEDGCADC